MAKKKNSVLGPVVQRNVPVDEVPLAVMVPLDQGGEENMAGSDVMEVAGEYAILADQEAELEKELKELRKKMDLRESWLLEQMAAGDMQKITVRGKTLYQIHDLIVSKSKGVSTEQLVEKLREVSLGDIVGETVPAPTLKALVKEARARAFEAKMLGEAATCSSCLRFFDKALVGHDCPECSNQEQGIALTAVFCGVPLALHNILYVEPIRKLGCRAAG